MIQDQKSDTSLGVAMLRAVHQMADFGPKILNDEVIVRLLPVGLLDHIRGRMKAYDTPAALGLRAHVLLRSRFAEDTLAQAYRHGTRQYLILGAGLDTFAYRQPPWAHDLKIFELDHPATQRHKLELLADAGIPMPGNLHYVPMNLESDALGAALSKVNLDPEQPLFISWLGVMAYLTEQTNDRILAYISGLPRGSELVFTFSSKDPPGHVNPLAALAAKKGEPWLTRNTRQELAEKFERLGFSKLTFLEPAVARKRYFRDTASLLPAPRKASIAHAVV